jgi:hypothetical protein
MKKLPFLKWNRCGNPNVIEHVNDDQQLITMHSAFKTYVKMHVDT